MRELIKLTGMVMKAGQAGENDRRLVILTRERGKITAFARGARRPGNSLMAVSRPFVFGHFLLYEGRDAYSLHSAEISNYFQEFSGDVEKTCYGSYFLEFADYYARENLEGTEILLLLYQSLRALLRQALPNRLVRRVFELKLMMVNGEYTEHPPIPVCESANYTWEYVLATPIESLYNFVVTDQVLEELGHCVDRNIKKYVDREFHSLEILKTIAET